MNEQAKVFLNKIREKIKNGHYDKELTIPFMNQESLYDSIRSRVIKKIKTGATPLLTEHEIKDAIQDCKELAVITSQIFLELGILRKTEKGFEVNEKFRKLI